ncbi:MAG TPA: SUMF1/EgtB/PvdO family nonheme iron enzyme [Polyangiaceae bacterium]|nr:SUMF1/EgtB/PvdO family nonheme iron enzyme [Polyangiaceae bacterium]
MSERSVVHGSEAGGSAANGAGSHLATQGWVRRSLTWVGVAAASFTLLTGAAACSEEPAGEKLGKAIAPLTLQAKLVAPGAAAARQFGAHVDFQGDTAAVAAPAVKATYVFERVAGVWQAPTVLDVNLMGSLAGIALDGDSLAVPAGGGAAVYVRSGGTWSLQQQVQVASPIGSAYSLALRGDTLVVGCVGNPATSAGVAYVFTRSGTTWTPQQTLSGAGLAVGAYFGAAVAVGTDLIVVGAPQVLGAPDVVQGAAFVFTRSGSVWSQVQRLDPPSPVSAGYYGQAVAIDRVGTRAVIAQFKPGSVYGFQISGGLLVAEASGNPGVNVSRVAMEGDRVIASGQILRRSGASYLYAGNLAKDDTALSGGVALVGGSEQANFYCVANCSNGLECGTGADCSSGHCVASLCCDKACSGANESCVVEKTGVPTGTCAPVQNGEDCTTGAECGSGNCTQGVCCSAACGATTDSCLAAETNLAQGTCGPIVKVVSCTQPSSCGSGSCVDGYCCDKPCTSDSQACAIEYTGLPNGTCGAVKNGTYCQSATECGSGFCSEQVCCDTACSGVTQSCRHDDTGLADGVCGAAPNGVQCFGTCDSGFCADNVCCSTACDGADDACVYAKTGLTTGTCGPIVLGVSCASDASCSSGHCVESVCCDAGCGGSNDSCLAAKTGLSDGVCAPIKNGTACANDNQCGSGLCREGVCCDTACGGTCESCRASQSGAPDGQCAPIPEGKDPANECDPAGSGVCRLPGTCSGARACKTSQDVPCGTSSCASDSVQVNAATCDGEGVCQAAGTSNCTPYKCVAGACASSCALDSDCLSPAVCLGDRCVQPVAEGETCDVGEECSSGHCVEGVCCDVACTGTCESCLGNQTGRTDGQCAPVLAGGSPRTSAGCESSGGVCGADGKCDGEGSCRVAAPKGVGCGTACEAGSEQLRECDGFGACATKTVMSCLPYRCVPGGNTCASECATSEDCAAGAQCNRNTGECAVTDATCKDQSTVLSPSGVETDCEPYRCSAGTCRDSCSTSNDCVAGYACEVGVCRADDDEGGAGEGPTSTSVNKDSGCSCRTAGAPVGGSAGAWVGLLGALLLARRRARSTVALLGVLALSSCKKAVAVNVDNGPRGNDDATLVDCSDAQEPTTHGGPTMVAVGREDGACVWIDSTEVSAAQLAELVALPAADYEALLPAGCANVAFELVSVEDGDRPAVGLDWCAAAAACASMGKRLCGEDESTKPASEWQTVCTDGDHDGFRYTELANPGVCVLAAREAADVGSTSTCLTPTSVFDLVGNVREWTAECSGKSPAGSCTVRGGSFLDPAGSAGCNLAESVERSHKADDLGFRCCADAPG